MQPDTNLFLTMGKFVQRQSENLLTQSLAAIFNNSPAFRRNLGKLLSSRRIDGAGVDLQDAHARTQQSQNLVANRIIVDTELCDANESSPCYVVEAKLEQALGKKQLAKYAEYLKSRARNASLVLLTKYSIDAELLPCLPKGTIWLTWMEVRELCRSLKGPRVDRFLAKEFAEMLDQNNVPSVDPISVGRWRKLRLFNDYAVSTFDSNVNWDTVETVRNAIARMRVFADAVWSPLTKEKYTPYARAYTWFPDETDDWDAFSALSVGYWRSGKGIYSRYLQLSLDCFDLELSVEAGWSLKMSHAEYDADDRWDYLKCWSAKASSDLFRRPTHESLAKILPDLRATLKKFKGTRYYKAK